ncbi:thiamine pyrophosphate-requiring protein [Pontibacter diazotrophicus]|uniref:Thiamine pyrophosphate-requiring protein n=1 Tax=Pontibacter diazotrophicus TaxID=1400979 RepID=A0A3D8L9X9_9BACT|nr:thiamine pyrophosphate-requiring protein [Pontibacter diazotrophicus]RDV14231.1 thiamine pyrophosphate-requiring protein [Pontibacter diazotrophicus]
MQQKVSDFLIERLSKWGVRRIFGYPGDGINGILGALHRANGMMDFVQVRHEEMASLMACAHAKFTGEVGVCLATSGPGAIHLLNGLYDAKLDHQPVVAIVGQKSRMSLGGHAQQEVDLMSLFKDVAGEYVHMATDARQVRHLIDRAMRIAKAQRTVTCIIVPNDVQELEYQDPPHEHGTIHSGIGYTVPRVIPQDEDLQKAAEVLNAGKKVAILIGAGAMNAASEVTQVADILGAGVAKAYLGKAALPDNLPFVTGAIGFFGTEATHKMMQGCDTLLMIGSSFPYAEFLPQEGQARGVQIDIDGRMLSIRYPMEVPLAGDSAETLRALMPLLHRKEDRSWQEKIKQDMQDWWKQIEAWAATEAKPLNPRLVFEKLSPRLPEDCILAADSGSTSSWTAQHIRMREGMQFSVSGTLATMGCAVPYAIAAKFAYPNRLAVAFAGDGAMQMGGNEELITIQKYWRQWSDPRLIVLVLNNHDLNFVTWEQRLMQGEPRFEASQELPDFNYAQYAESLGLTGIRIDSPEQVEAALEKALQADRPVVIEAITDPEVVPFSPQVAVSFSDKLASAIRQGDEAAERNLREPLRSAVERQSEKG